MHELDSRRDVEQAAFHIGVVEAVRIQNVWFPLSQLLDGACRTKFCRREDRHVGWYVDPLPFSGLMMLIPERHIEAGTAHRWNHE
jgi:hypothetical protein